MLLANGIGSPSLKNESISGWESPEANRWDKSTSRLAGVAAEAKLVRSFLDLGLRDRTADGRLLSGR